MIMPMAVLVCLRYAVRFLRSEGDGGITPLISVYVCRLETLGASENFPLIFYALTLSGISARSILYFQILEACFCGFAVYLLVAFKAVVIRVPKLKRYVANYISSCIVEVTENL